jgi:putative selenium metabolism hydrolase
VIDLLMALVSTPSLSGEEGSVVAMCAEAMRDLGFDVSTDAAGNAVGVIGSGPRRILFDGHADTVAANPRWTRDPHDARVDADRVWGLGSTDMKGPIAALIHGVADAARDGTLRCTAAVSISTLEEVMEGAALAPVVESFRPDAVVIAEPSGSRVTLAQKGRAEIIVEVEGRAAHAAFPELGANAVDGAAAVLVALGDRPVPEDAELGAGVLVVTEAVSDPVPGVSVVPSRMCLRLDRRTLPGEQPSAVLDELGPYLQAASRAGCRATAELSEGVVTTYSGAVLPARRFLTAWKADRGHPFVAAALAALDEGPPARFCTNGSLTADLGIPTVIYGPGDPEHAHQADESITLEQLVAGRRGFAALASLDSW